MDEDDEEAEASLDDAIDSQDDTKVNDKSLAGFQSKKTNYSKQMLEALEKEQKKKEEFQAMIADDPVADLDKTKNGDTSVVSILQGTTPKNKTIYETIQTPMSQLGSTKSAG